MLKLFCKFGLVISIIFAISAAFCGSVPASAHFSTSTFAYSGDTAENPINLAWYGSGNNVNSKFSTLGWGSATGNTLSVYFEDSINGGTDYWKNQDAQVQDPDGSFWGTRIHVRIFESNYTDPGGFGDWAVGNAEKEHWDWLQLTHVLDSWEDGQTTVKNAFTGAAFTGSIYSSNYSNSGTYHGQYNDGYATFIQLTY
jgi:hypothetical protein